MLKKLPGYLFIVLGVFLLSSFYRAVTVSMPGYILNHPEITKISGYETHLIILISIILFFPAIYSFMLSYKFLTKRAIRIASAWYLLILSFFLPEIPIIYFNLNGLYAGLATIIVFVIFGFIPFRLLNSKKG